MYSSYVSSQKIYHTIQSPYVCRRIIDSFQDSSTHVPQIATHTRYSHLEVFLIPSTVTSHNAILKPIGLALPYHKRAPYPNVTSVVKFMLVQLNLYTVLLTPNESSPGSPQVVVNPNRELLSRYTGRAGAPSCGSCVLSASPNMRL